MKRFLLLSLVLPGLIVVCALDFFALSSVSYERSQQLLYSDFSTKLRDGTAPVDVPAGRGAPVAILSVPAIGISEVVVEGTSSRELQSAVGHLRGSSMPGQVGTSVMLGRRAAFGGVFSSISSLVPGDEVRVTSAQGTTTYLVRKTSFHRADDAAAFAPAGDAIRLVTSTGLLSADQRISVLAVAQSDSIFPLGNREAIEAVSLHELGLNLDHGESGALLVLLQTLLLVVILVLWVVTALRMRETWYLLAPVVLGVMVAISRQVLLLLPSTL